MEVVRDEVKVFILLPLGVCLLKGIKLGRSISHLLGLSSAEERKGRKVVCQDL